MNVLERVNNLFSYFEKVGWIDRSPGLIHNYLETYPNISILEENFEDIRKECEFLLSIKEEISDISRFLIIPMSLQLLVENAIKHNAATDEKPLTIKIYLENDYIVILNNVNRKKLYEPTSKIGLNNLSKRYKYLTSKNIEVIDENNEFIVKLPIIKK